MSGAPHSISPLLGVGTPTWGKVSTAWARSYASIGGPLGATRISFDVLGKPIAEARNELMQQAISHGCDYLFMVGDDVLIPDGALPRLLQRLWDNPDLHMVCGVYWTKQWPTAPYLWRGLQRGPFLDWQMGEFLEIDFSGCDCLLIRLSPEMKALGPDWFSTDWVWTEEQERPDTTLNTEDFSFYIKARQAGLKLWCDTSVQCIHEDRNTGLQYGLLEGMPQAGGAIQVLPETDDGGPVLIADIGAGKDSPYFGEPGTVKVVRFDGNEKLRPDFRCDIRHLPVPDQSFQIVHARHVLEHFGRGEVLAVLREWVRILKIGGEFRICVPNLLWAFEHVTAMESGSEPPNPVPFWVLYGRQDDAYDFHKNGFTPVRLKLLLEHLGTLDDVDVQITHEGFNLEATAKKVRHEVTFALVPAWEQALAAEAEAEQQVQVELAAGEQALGLGESRHEPAGVVLAEHWNGNGTAAAEPPAKVKRARARRG